MDSVVRLHFERAENELVLAEIIYDITGNKEIQQNVFHVNNVQSFYSAAITHAYYSIFYCAKAYLLHKGIKIEVPNEHKKTYDEFEKIVLTGVIDVELLKIYKEMIIKADVLLGIFKLEKDKRGEYTYQKLSQANMMPALESINHAKVFFKNMVNLIEF